MLLVVVRFRGLLPAGVNAEHLYAFKVSFASGRPITVGAIAVKSSIRKACAVCNLLLLLANGRPVSQRNHPAEIRLVTTYLTHHDPKN